MKVYKFRKYEEIFPELYNNEKKRLRKVISKNSLIEHVGSTAVPGLPGKGIIDIMILCPKSKINQIKDNLEKNGYELRISSDKNRVFLKREAKIDGKSRRFHIHITSQNHPVWNDAVSFRNYLIKNQKVSRKYAGLKEKAVISCKNDGEIYRRLKDRFIKKHIKKARKK